MTAFCDDSVCASQREPASTFGPFDANWNH